MGGHSPEPPLSSHWVRSDPETAGLVAPWEGEAVVVVVVAVTINEVLDVPELIDVAGDADGTIMVEAKLLLRLL